MSMKHDICTATRQVQTPAGAMEVFAASPCAGHALPAVVILMDMWGFRATVRDIACEVAAMGYHALLPDLYHRTDPVRLDNEMAGTVPRRFTDIPSGVQRRLRAAMDSLADDDVVGDVSRLLDAAPAWAPVNGHAGLVGYCMGGRHALCVAGARPDAVRASACLHGTALIGDSERSAHRIALAARGEIYCGHAQLDEYAAGDVPQRLHAALAGGGATFASVVHDGARHGYALPDRAVHDPQATAADWAAIAAMFARQLNDQ